MACPPAKAGRGHLACPLRALPRALPRAGTHSLLLGPTCLMEVRLSTLTVPPTQAFPIGVYTEFKNAPRTARRGDQGCVARTFWRFLIKVVVNRLMPFAVASGQQRPIVHPAAANGPQRSASSSIPGADAVRQPTPAQYALHRESRCCFETERTGLCAYGIASDSPAMRNIARCPRSRHCSILHFDPMHVACQAAQTCSSSKWPQV